MKIIPILKEIILLLDKIPQNVPTEENTLKEITQTLFEISWRSNELPWSIKDHEKYKTVIPWKNLDYIAHSLVVADTNKRKKFIGEFISEKNELREGINAILAVQEKILCFQKSFLSLQSRLVDRKDFDINRIDGDINSIKANDFFNDIKKLASKNFPHIKSFTINYLDNLYLKQMHQHLQDFFSVGAIDYTSELNRIAFFRLLELLGEYAGSLSDDTKLKYADVLWKKLREIRHAIEHLEQNERVSRNMKILKEDQTGYYVNLLAEELKELPPIIDNLIKIRNNPSSTTNPIAIIVFSNISLLTAEDILVNESNIQSQLDSHLQKLTVERLIQYHILLQELAKYIFSTPKKNNQKIRSDIQELCRLSSSKLIENPGDSLKDFLKKAKNSYSAKLSIADIVNEILETTDKIISSDKTSTINADYFIQILKGKSNFNEETYNNAVDFFSGNNQIIKKMLLEKKEERKWLKKGTHTSLKPFPNVDNIQTPIDKINKLHTLMQEQDLAKMHKPEEVRFLLNQLEKQLPFPIDKQAWIRAYLQHQEDLLSKANLSQQEKTQEQEKLAAFKKGEESKLPAEINRMSSTVERLVTALKQAQTSVPSIHQIIHARVIEYYIEKIGDIAIDLSDNYLFQQANNPQSISYKNLLFLNNLRKLLAHRSFELRNDLIHVTTENITSFMRVDLNELAANLCPLPLFSDLPAQSIYLKLDPSFFLTHQEEIKKLCRKYGIEEMRIVGRFAEQPFGTMADLDLVIKHSKNSGMLELLRFEMDLQDLLNIEVRVMTAVEFEEQCNAILDNDHKSQINKKPLYFKDFLQQIDIQERIKANNLQRIIANDKNLHKENFNDIFTEVDELDTLWKLLVAKKYLTSDGNITKKFKNLNNFSEMQLGYYGQAIQEKVYKTIKIIEKINADPRLELYHVDEQEAYKKAKSVEFIVTRISSKDMDKFFSDSKRKQSYLIEREENEEAGNKIFHIAINQLANQYMDQFRTQFDFMRKTIGEERLINLIKDIRELHNIQDELEQMAQDIFNTHYKECFGDKPGWVLNNPLLTDRITDWFQNPIDGRNYLINQIKNILLPSISNIQNSTLLSLLCNGKQQDWNTKIKRYNDLSSYNQVISESLQANALLIESEDLLTVALQAWPTLRDAKKAVWRGESERLEDMLASIQQGMVDLRPYACSSTSLPDVVLKTWDAMIHYLADFESADEIYKHLWDEDSTICMNCLYNELLERAKICPQQPVPAWIVSHFPQPKETYYAVNSIIKEMFLYRVEKYIQEKRYCSPTLLTRYYFEFKPIECNNGAENVFYEITRHLLPSKINIYIDLYNQKIENCTWVLKEYIEILENIIADRQPFPTKEAFKAEIFKSKITFAIPESINEVNDLFDNLWNKLDYMRSSEEIQSPEIRSMYYQFVMEELIRKKIDKKHQSFSENYLEKNEEIKSSYDVMMEKLHKNITRLYELHKELQETETYRILSERKGYQYELQNLTKKSRQKRIEIHRLSNEILKIINNTQADLYFMQDIHYDLSYFLKMWNQQEKLLGGEAPEAGKVFKFEKEFLSQEIKKRKLDILNELFRQLAYGHLPILTAEKLKDTIYQSNLAQLLGMRDRGYNIEEEFKRALVNGYDDDAMLQLGIQASLYDQGSQGQIEQRKEDLKNCAAKFNYICNDVKGDGNCFYYAVADQLKRLGKQGQDIDPDILRMLVAVEISTHLEYYRDFIQEDEQANYSVNIAKPYTWVDIIAAQAMARIKNIIVAIIPSDSGMPQILKPAGANQVIVLGNEVDIHFQSLTATDKPIFLSQTGATYALQEIINNTPELENPADYLLIKHRNDTTKQRQQFDERFGIIPRPRTLPSFN